MKSVLLQRAMKLNKNRKKRQWWQRLVQSMAIIVVFCTTYALILPALTMAEDPICGFEAHTHTEECYTQQALSVLSCTAGEDVLLLHTHGDGCYDNQGNFCCSLEKLEAHVHEDSCWELGSEPQCAYVHVHTEQCRPVTRELICQLEEVEGHAHSEDCQRTCELEETEGHTHTEDCQRTCELEENEEHTHSEDCQRTCPLEETPGHTHSEECQRECQLEEVEGHVHGDDCYEQTVGECTLTVEGDHVHDESCYSAVLVCGKEEIVPHTHGDDCYDGEGALVCTRPQVVEHTHGEDCWVVSDQTEKVLTCTLPEHVHTDACYPVETEEEESIYFCGAGEHAHVATCIGEDGNLACDIPEHHHTQLCMVEDLDLTADIETPQQWETAFEDLDLTGVWAEDLLTVAKTQLGYRESTRNLSLVNDELRGYTRYGEKYGDPYGEWSAMFVSFCLDYARAEQPERCYDCADWAAELESQLRLPGSDTPSAGDLLFLDTDAEDGVDEADHMGIVAEILQETGEVRILAGNAAAGEVDYETYSLADEAIVGFLRLPENPNLAQAEENAQSLGQLLTDLPTADQARARLQELNRTMDKDGYDQYLAWLNTRIPEVRAAYELLNDLQKERTDLTQWLADLETVCQEALWRELPVLETDDAVISALEACHPEGTAEEEPVVALGQTAFFGFRAQTTAYGETVYGEARVKVEFELPAAEDQAVFDMEAMPWLEEPVLTQELRLVGEEEIPCQILTGFLKVTAQTLDAPVAPGTFSSGAAVKILNMPHNERLHIRIRAALAHNAWEDTCEEHEIGETLTIQSKNVVVSAQASPEEQQAAYEAFLAEYEALLLLEEDAQPEKADELADRISQAYLRGGLSEEGFKDLSEKVYTLIYGNLNNVAEYAVGNNWRILRDSGWFEAYSDYAQQSARLEPRIFLESAPAPMLAAAATGNPQNQIMSPGGNNISQESAVQVSKTIEPTDIENVFDITLEVITKDVVTEVYKEPDMAVVIVMDISQTMNNNLNDDITRYKAAMAAAEAFLDQFAANNLGASKVGFVAFNTDAHEIFPLSSCANADQVNALKNTMRTKTGAIINANGYADAHSRFTNIEGGLKRAYDLLANATNEHKYIIFLSDGFPTTYLESGYKGYDPYDKDGTRFYDAVELYNGKNRPCTYGTSYSDEAAIRARTMATTLKNAGTTIFSIGVDIGGQTIKYYVDSFIGDSFSVVDRRNTNYEIGSADDENAFKNWLGYSIGSGDGYYYDSDDSEGLGDAFDDIFARIKEINAASSYLDWVTTDPMPNMGVQSVKGIEFIGFYDKYLQLTTGNLVGESGESSLTPLENTAKYDPETKIIEWDLKKSRYYAMAFDDTTNYHCYLRYRVRLMNENNGFEEYVSYDTNDVTSLAYRVIEKKGDNVTISEQRYVNYPIPAVRGYLAELSFEKEDSNGNPVVGAEFTLYHDTDDSDGRVCVHCRGDGTSFVEVPVYMAVSGEDGVVKFENIPSGHTYILEETKVPDGYKPNGNAYQVSVSYDALEVKVWDMNGNALTWEDLVVNITSYKLPNTGGSGTYFLTFGGLLMIAVPCVYFVIQAERKKRRGGMHS